MSKISDIIFWNKALQRAREEMNISKYETFILKLHKAEIKDKVPLGTYILKF